MSAAKKILMSTAAGGEALNVEDVFSIYNYEGDNTLRNIKNGINLGTNIVDSATNFNGGSYLYKNGFTMSRSKEITFSAWFQPIANPVTSFSLVAVESFYFNVYGNKDQLLFVGRNTSNTNIVYAEITSSNMFQPNNWYNIQISFDLTNSSNRHVYLNGTELSMTWSTYLDQEIDTLRSHTYIGTRSGSDYLYQSNMAHFFLDTNYIDLSVQSNRELFYPASDTFPDKNILHSLSARIYMPMTKSFALGGNIGQYNNSTDFTASSSGVTLTNVTLGTAASAEGGLVWIKGRDTYQGGAVEHALFDTERGIYKPLNSTNSTAASTTSYGINAYNTDGWSFNVGFSGRWNGIHSGVGTNYCSWTFRKAPKFFDIVTYTGNGSPTQTISHNLGTTVGTIIIKKTSSAGNWIVHHKDMGSTSGYLNFALLESSNAQSNGNSFILHSVSSTSFTVGNGGDINGSGASYVAYLFAHNDGDSEFGPTGDQDIIKCGSYTGNGTYLGGPVVDLGFEPQWLLVKNVSSNDQPWRIADSLRGINTGTAGAYLSANLDNIETLSLGIELHPKGFQLMSNNQDLNFNGEEYIYIAIRRGPMAIAENSKEVFDIFEPLQYDTELPANPKFKAEFPIVDFGLQRLAIGSSGNVTVFDRLRGSGKGLETNSDDTESAASVSSLELDYNYGYQPTSGGVSHFQSFGWMWSRAPNFFDVVTYTGNGTSGRTLDHNLGVAPEMMWVKSRTSYDDWYVYHSATGNTQYMILNTYVTSATTDSTVWNNTSPSNSSFTLGSNTNVNGSGKNYVAYLFASLDGVSKVGTYAGSSSSQNIDCGFSNGAKLVLIHRISNPSIAGDWYLFDSERGIYDTTFAAGRDQYLRINTIQGQTVNQDYLEPYSAGFGVNTNTAYINASGSNYVFYAIANP